MQVVQPVAVVQPIAVVQPVAVVAEDPLCAIRWRRGTAIASGCTLAAVLLLILGLILKTVMYIDGSIATIIHFEVKVDYYDASVNYHYSGETGQTNDIGLSDATCDKKGMMKFAAALHFFAIGAAVSLAAALGNELRTKQIKNHVVLAAFICTGALLSLYNAILAIVRNHANYSNCSTVVPGLERYGMGGCWLCADAAYGLIFWGGVAYICSRYMKCCCYQAPIAVVYQQPLMQQQQQQVVVGQPMQQPAYAQQQQQPMYQQQSQQQDAGMYAPPQKTV